MRRYEDITDSDLFRKGTRISKKRILAVLRKNPEATAKEIAKKTNLTEAEVSYTLRSIK